MFAASLVRLKMSFKQILLTKNQNYDFICMVPKQKWYQIIKSQNMDDHEANHCIIVIFHLPG